MHFPTCRSTKICSHTSQVTPLPSPTTFAYPNLFHFPLSLLQFIKGVTGTTDQIEESSSKSLHESVVLSSSISPIGIPLPQWIFCKKRLFFFSYFCFFVSFSSSSLISTPSNERFTSHPSHLISGRSCDPQTNKRVTLFCTQRCIGNLTGGYYFHSHSFHLLFFFHSLYYSFSLIKYIHTEIWPHQLPQTEHLRFARYIFHRTTLRYGRREIGKEEEKR